eukprot:jgi/Hompol1/4128/HPOL_006945-RA
MWAISQPFCISINGYWAMDQGRYEIAAALLSDPSIDLDWTQKVLKTLLRHRHFRAARQFIQRVNPAVWTQPELEMHLDVLIHTNFPKALSFQRQHAAVVPQPVLFERLVHHCLEKPYDLNGLKCLADMPLLPVEEECLIGYCRSKATTLCLDFMITYYLNRARYVEAIVVYDEFFASSLTPGDVKGEARRQMIENIRLVVPQVKRDALQAYRDNDRQTVPAVDDALDMETDEHAVPIAPSAALPLSALNLSAGTSNGDIPQSKLLLALRDNAVVADSYDGSAAMEADVTMDHDVQ